MNFSLAFYYGFAASHCAGFPLIVYSHLNVSCETFSVSEVMFMDMSVESVANLVFHMKHFCVLLAVVFFQVSYWCIMNGHNFFRDQ